MAAPGDHAWLQQHQDELLNFYQPHVMAPSGGYWWLGDDATIKPEQGHPLWIAARMTHCFSLAHLMGRDGAAQVAQHGVQWLTEGAGKDHEHGGWFVAVDGAGADDSKELYGFAHVILAGSSATQAGIEGGRPLLDEALRLVDVHFWDDEVGAGVDRFDRTFTECSDYRGMNANMHLTEAYMAAAEATGEQLWWDRALGLARRFAGRGHHRLPEHFDTHWQPRPEHHRDEPDHPFQPYGSTPGHWLEWAKLCAQLAPQFRHETWLLPRAEELFRGAVDDAWAENGGFVYTVDWDGTPVVANRFFWPITEGIGAAHCLHLATGDADYAQWYERLWRFADQHLVDHELGSWHSELDDELTPTKRTWDGKPDLYHVLQATLYASTPLEAGLAAHLAEQSQDRSRDVPENRNIP